MFNDIWSLGIILLNVATGRNPWESATPGDPTFQAYLRDPMGFLPTVLPISPEVNEILVKMLDVDWHERNTLHHPPHPCRHIERWGRCCCHSCQPRSRLVPCDALRWAKQMGYQLARLSAWAVSENDNGKLHLTSCPIFRDCHPTVGHTHRIEYTVHEIC